MAKKKMDTPEFNKLLIIHADDAGLCHSENKATMDALRKETVSSYSIMTCCPGFDEMANFAKANPEFDNGVHLTLTCEWEEYRFGPVLPINQVPSLVDENGFFHKTRENLKIKASVEDVRKELSAQIEKALRYGLNPSHIDSHMYSLGSTPELMKVYKDLGRKYNLPVLLNKELIEVVGGIDAKQCLDNSDLVIDNIFYVKDKDFEKRDFKTYYDGVLDNLSPGINMLLIHLAFDDIEMKDITKNHPNFGSEWRQMDFDYFISDGCKNKLNQNGIELITWSDINQ